jgi:phosphate transport system substrate-binding protein
MKVFALPLAVASASYRACKRVLELTLNIVLLWTFLVSVVNASWLEGKVTPIEQEVLVGKQLFAINGSNTLGSRLLPELVKEYLKEKGVANIRTRSNKENEMLIVGNDNSREITVSIEAHGSSTGFKGLSSGVADFAASSRRIKKSEEAELKRLGNMKSRETEHVIAIDGIAIVVNPENNIRELTIEQVANLFSGEISDWSRVGARPGRVMPYARDAASGTWDTFSALVMKKRHQLSSSAPRFESNTEVVSKVLQSRSALGFVGVASIKDTKAVALNGAGDHALLPSVLTIATEDYPLARRLYLYTSETKPKLIEEFLNFALSNPGQEVVDNLGFISQRIRVVKFDTKYLPSEYQKLVEGRQRLSINFRFTGNSADMDGKAELDVERLAHYMKTEASGKSLLLVGFDNRQAAKSRSMIMSKLRAMNVKRRLTSLQVSAEVASLGDGFLIADPNTPLGESKNQRVEVWIK